MRYRQVHLDFHTSGHIPDIGIRFDKKKFQQTLLDAHVDSVTCFSSCHHGWSYHPTEVGRMHPNLNFDLLGAQIEACKEAGINVPVYLTAGVNDVAADAHPEWREVGSDGRYLGWAPDVLTPGFKTVCFNSPYLEYLCAQITETLTRYPNCDGIFLDIIMQGSCCCKYCLAVMRDQELDPADEVDRKKCAELALLRYYKMTAKTVWEFNSDMPLFHNSGHIRKDAPELLNYFSHLEMESLPTGGWGYDHFPMSVKYAMNHEVPYLGMTGKFNSTWGEFGGFKHPNALLYETAAMLAFNAGCSVGDQLHPCGELDVSTYKLIGRAYEQVEKNEPWCIGAKNVADIALVSVEAVNKIPLEAREDIAADTGAARLLLEGHYLFDTIDDRMDLARYKLIILPDEIKVGPEFKAKLDAFLASGGKVMLTGSSGFDESGNPLFDIGADCFGESEYCPDYVQIAEAVRPDFIETPLVMYLRSRRIKVTVGTSLGKVYDPYFNREAGHFCSHQHTPYRTEDSGFDCGVVLGNLLYLSHPVFSIYRFYGAVAYKQVVLKCIDQLLADEKSLATNLPSTARISLMDQAAEHRMVLHLLYAEKICRGGGTFQVSGSEPMSGQVEVIEDLIPLHQITVRLKTTKPVKSVMLQPEGRKIDAYIEDGCISFVLDSLTCHAIVELSYGKIGFSG